MRDNSIVLICAIVILCVIIFGGHLGIGYSGSLEKPTASSDEPGLLSLFSWIWTGITFYFQIMTFQIPNMPVLVTAIFILIPIMMLFILIKVVRGNASP